MGYRLHVHKKHVIEYGVEGFTNGSVVINTLLSSFCNFCGNDDYDKSASEIEIDKPSFKNLAFSILTAPNVKEILSAELSDFEVKQLEEIGFDKIAKTFQEMYNNSDPSDKEYIYFNWF